MQRSPKQTAVIPSSVTKILHRHGYESITDFLNGKDSDPIKKNQTEFETHCGTPDVDDFHPPKFFHLIQTFFAKKDAGLPITLPDPTIKKFAGFQRK